jgi:hypothetical protein
VVYNTNSNQLTHIYILVILATVAGAAAAMSVFVVILGQHCLHGIKHVIHTGERKWTPAHMPPARAVHQTKSALAQALPALHRIHSRGGGRTVAVGEKVQASHFRQRNETPDKKKVDAG